MKVLRHGIYYNKTNKIKCNCGCEFEYDAKDIETDYSLSLMTNPTPYKTFVTCPECGIRTYLGTTYTSSKTVKFMEMNKEEQQ